MSSENKIKIHPTKKSSSKIFENDYINKENIKIELDNELIHQKKNNEQLNKNKRKKVKFNKKIDVTSVESWKKFNAENTSEPNTNNKDTTKCTCVIF